MFLLSKKYLSFILISCYLSFLTFCFLSKPVIAEELESQLKKAQNYFDLALNQRGTKRTDNFLRAAKKFKTISQNNKIKNGYLFYNIGNSYLEAGKLGEAVLFYRRAQRLIPGYSSLRNNLYIAREKVNFGILNEDSLIEIAKSFFFWHYLTDYHQKIILFISFFTIFWLFLIVLFQNKILLLRWSLYFLFILTVSTGLSLAFSCWEIYGEKSGVVITKKSNVYKGPGKSYDPAFNQSLPAGVEFKLLETHKNWYKIQINSGKICWILKKNTEII